MLWVADEERADGTRHGMFSARVTRRLQLAGLHQHSMGICGDGPVGCVAVQSDSRAHDREPSYVVVPGMGLVLSCPFSLSLSVCPVVACLD